MTINRTAEAHITVSKYIIYLSKSKRVLLKDDIAELTVEISRIGNNINQIAYIGNYQKYVNRTQLKVVSEYLKQVEDLQRKILRAMFSDEDHTLITLEKKIEKLTKSVCSFSSKVKKQ